ncbi:type II toxin-antitoxin system PemK/MazF family toxin [Leuconostocaceae bacterium ESL0958]|nr:type II toxin-antitoxin system PemK/MazF family toxin [Leuconostocaceae bacterium ESL0958]
MPNLISEILSNKINKLQPFTDFYFSDNEDFKSKMMPNWIETYGHFLNNELTGRQKFYPILKQGTIIMINFGINVGEELSGPHFGIVINANDDKRIGKITVLPLTSKYHKGHVRLGKNIVDETLALISTKQAELKEIRNELDRSTGITDNLINNFIDTHVTNIDSLSHETMQILIEAFSIMPSNFSDDFEARTEVHIKNKMQYVRSFLEKISKNPNFESNSELSSFYYDMTALLSSMDISIKQLDIIRYRLSGLENLKRQLVKYNNDSFADIKNMTTVSKTRVNKLSEYDISGNVSISPDSLNKIKENIHSFLNI